MAGDQPNEDDKRKITRGELTIIILTAVLAALSAGFYFAPPGSPRAVKIATFIIMISTVIVAIIVAHRVSGLRGLRAISLVLLVAIPAGALGAATAWQLKRAHDTTASKQGAQLSAHNILHFLGSPNTVVPWCSTFYGRGRIPKGDSLLIFDSPADNAGNLLKPKEYGFHGAARGLPNGSWSISDVYVLQKGDSDKRAILFGVLETNRDANFVKNIIVSGHGYWRSGALPSGLGWIDPLLVVRSGGLGCANH